MSEREDALSLALILSGNYFLKGDLLLPSCCIYHSEELDVKTIPDQRFACSELSSVCIPESIEKLGTGCFRRCKFLRSVSFERCTAIRALPSMMFLSSRLSSFQVPCTVEEIGHGCFGLCKDLITVSFEPGSICRIIGSKAFKKSRLRRICIPASVEVIGEECFAECPLLEYIQFDKNSKLQKIGCSAFYSSPKLRVIDIPQSTHELELGKSAFMDCLSLSDFDLSHFTFSKLEDSLFFRSELRSIVIPVTVRSIESECFKGCRKLTLVEFQEESALLKIGREAFAFCSFCSIKIPDSVRLIDVKAFVYCGCLSRVEFSPHSQLESVMYKAFAHCASDQIELPKGAIVFGKDLKPV